MIYHSGTIKLEKRYSYGLSFLTFADLAEGYPELPGQSLPERPIDAGGHRHHSEVPLRQFHDLRAAVRQGQEVPEP
jgi:hypothetical protein